MTDEWEPDEVTKVGEPTSLIDGDRRESLRGTVLILAGSNTGEMVVLDRHETVFGRSEQCDIQLFDAGISRRHCAFRRDGSAFFIDDLGSRNGTFVNGHSIASQRLADGDKIQLGRTTIVRFSLHDELDESFHKQLLDSALRDGMTRAYNRRYFLDRLDAEFKFAVRHDQPLTLLVLDLDHFKAINDTHGHLAGDQALKVFAAHVQAQIRNEDVFARFGGEEFAVISRSIDLEGARIFADRLRTAVSQLEVAVDEARFGFTVSIGIAAIPEHNLHDSVALLDAADQALYGAKRQGRNRVEVYEPLPPGADEDPDTA